MKGRHVTWCACLIQLLCASHFIINFVGAAPQGLVSGATFVPDSRKIFNNGPQNSGSILPGIQLSGPNFISTLDSTDKSTISNSRPQEPIFTISQPQESTINRSQPPQQTISNSQPASQPPASTISVSQPQIVSVSQPQTISVSQPQTISVSQPQFSNQNALTTNSQAPQQSVFINQQPPVNDLRSVQPAFQEQQPEIVLRSQSENIIPQQQNVVEPQPILQAGVQESFIVINEDGAPIQSQGVASVDNSINQIQSVNRDNNLGGQLVETSGASSLVSFLPEEQVVELQIPFFTNQESISVQPVTGNTFGQNQLQQDHNSVQPRTSSLNSLAKNLDSVNSIDTQADNFVKQGPSNVESADNKMGVPLSSVVSAISENSNVGVPISSTSLDNVNENAPEASVPIIATEDNSLRSSQSPTSDADLNLIASLTSAVNNDANLISSLASASGTNTGSDFGSQTLGELLLSMNGQEGIIVLPMDSLGGSTASELLGGTNSNDVTFRSDDGTSATSTADAGSPDAGAADDLGALLDTFIADYGTGFEDDFEDLPPVPPSPPNIFRSTLADTLFVKGQFLGTLLGGLLDLGGAVTGQLKQLTQKS